MAPIITHIHAMENHVLITDNTYVDMRKESRLDLASKVRLFLNIPNAFPMHVE